MSSPNTSASRLDEFFWFARERHAIHLRRRAGLPRSAWTQDPVLQAYRFTNVFRELDATTVWFREHVREPMRGDPNVLLATVLFRWFNRVQTGEAIFSQPDLLGGDTAWFMMNIELAMNNGVVDQGHGCSATDPLWSAIHQYCGDGPYVTGAYIVKTPDGMDKLTGVLKCVEWFLESRNKELHFEDCWNQREVAQFMLDRRGEVTLQDVWSWLRQFPYMGDFMAYEVVTDLRHTDLLCNAPDVMTWANLGPGAKRGLNRVHGRTPEAPVSRAQGLEEMREILEASRSFLNWPQYNTYTKLWTNSLEVEEQVGDRIQSNPEDWPVWELRDVEHGLCEAFKWWSARDGKRQKRRFR